MNESKPTAAPAVNGARLAKLNSPLFIWPATAALAVLLYFALSYLNDFLTHESTDDAFVDGHVVSVAPRISGQVPPSTFWTTSSSTRTTCSWKLTRRITRRPPRRNNPPPTRRKRTTNDARRTRVDARKVTTAEAAAEQSKADTAAAEATDARAKADFRAQPGIAEAKHDFAAGI